MNIRLTSVLCGGCLLLTGIIKPWSAEAEWRLLSGLRAGMNKGEVAALLGPARKKQEYELKRRTAWDYPLARLIFEEGTLIRWESRHPIEVEDSAQPRSAGGDEHVKVSPEAEALLSEILKEIPSDGDAPGASPPSRSENAPGAMPLRSIPEDAKFRGEMERD